MVQTEVIRVMIEGDAITTTVTSSCASVERWLNEVLSVHRRRLHNLVVGLDVEWRPLFGPGYSRTALLQLCVGRRCLIFQLLHADYIPDALADFLGDSDFRFVGVGVGEDAVRLSNDLDLDVANTVDLAELAAEEMGRPDLRDKGLKAIASAVMDVDIEKPHEVRVGPWDNYYLSDQQIKYA
ncbi:hypothetical protein C2845_PM07G17660 [Panicum miliaceum]|uniref:3'-5' exonuclease domain-containing protein n=1 Tax=Panicum miliaceum TaxID=4540 RepID=A0A3L6SRL5_PANMI|nr:hypothetical protein C2845_PM07G17660 [Panicum miliaceum]